MSISLEKHLNKITRQDTLEDLKTEMQNENKTIHADWEGREKKWKTKRGLHKDGKSSFAIKATFL